MTWLIDLNWLRAISEDVLACRRVVSIPFLITSLNRCVENDGNTPN